MPSPAAATQVNAARGGSGGGGGGGGSGAPQQSTIYKGITTPIIFVSFLVSLACVDLRYTLKRSRNHGHDHGGGWMPAWLHGIVYRRSPYHYLQPRGEQSAPSPRDRDEQGEWYYHSKQKKLMRMEVDDAFEMRGHVLVVLGLASLAVAWGLWILSAWLWRSL